MFGAAHAWRTPACGARPALRGLVLPGEGFSPCRSQIWLRTPLQHLPGGCLAPCCQRKPQEGVGHPACAPSARRQLQGLISPMQRHGTASLVLHRPSGG